MFAKLQSARTVRLARHCAARLSFFTSFASLTSSKPFRIRTSKTPLPQLLYNPHLQAPLGSAGNKGLITPLESALTRNSPVSLLESALTKRWGVGVRDIPVRILDSGEVSWTSATGDAATGRSAPISFPCHTSEKSPANSNHCHTSKTAFRKSFVCHTSKTPRRCFAVRSASFWAGPASGPPRGISGSMTSISRKRIHGFVQQTRLGSSQWRNHRSRMTRRENHRLAKRIRERELTSGVGR